MDLKKIRQKKSIRELLDFGIIIIDKPSGPTSFQVSDFVRKKLEILGVKKTSHFGTLDPKVTGVLPIAFNRACKLTGFFIGKNKEYVGVMRSHEKIDIVKLQEIINKKFIGKIIQKPPVRSRVKRVEREREINHFKIIESDDEQKNFLFKADVQGGTYIRKLIDDLGKETEIGAHMLELRRTKAGIFLEEESFNLYELEEAIEKYKNGDEEDLKKMIIPGEVVSQIFPVLEIKEKFVDKALHGSPIFYEYLKEKKDVENLFCLFCEEKFVGIYKAINQEKIFAKPEFVLQEVK